MNLMLASHRPECAVLVEMDPEHMHMRALGIIYVPSRVLPCSSMLTTISRKHQEPIPVRIILCIVIWIMGVDGDLHPAS